MSQKPLVVVVTPVYNGANYLEETIQSVQAQLWPNVVHLILDNCSTDETPEIIKRYEDGRVPILSYRNDETINVFENWNKAISLVPSEAKYIRILCHDDTITPDAIEKMALLAESDPGIGVVGCLHDCAGAVQDFKWPASRSVFEGDEAIRMILLGEGVLMPIHVLVRKSVADSRQPFLQQFSLKSGARDFDAMMCLLQSSKFGFVHEGLAFTRVHEEAITAQNFMGKTRSWTADALCFLTKFGPDVFNEDYQEHLLRFRRYYVRRILRWRKQDGGEQNLARHFEELENAGWHFGWQLVADAIADWFLQRIKLRRNWTGYPGWQ
ncbi:MAG: glycosyltransferase family 2 protein [Hyphomonas sp.]|uniref:glycosyltransferase family A protein n=1 Tax=Hyphomonas sp. TaxID=87 RepID=UPI003526F1C9